MFDQSLDDCWKSCFDGLTMRGRIVPVLLAVAGKAAIAALNKNEPLNRSSRCEQCFRRLTNARGLQPLLDTICATRPKQTGLCPLRVTA